MRKNLDNQTHLAISNLSTQNIDLIFKKIVSSKVDYADLYFQYSKNEFWSLEDGRVNNGSFSIDQGVGLRSIVGEKTAFTYSDEISLNALENGVKILKSIQNQGQSKSYDMTKSINQPKLTCLLIQLRVNRLKKKLNCSIKLKLRQRSWMLES